MNTKKKAAINILLLTGIAVLLIFSGCRSGRKDKATMPPPGIIPADTMVQILVDIHLIEASLKVKHAKKEENERFTEYYYDQLFEKHNINREQFDQSIEYYERDAEMIDKIYERVITELNKIQSQIN